MIRELFMGIFKTKTHTMNVIIVIVVCTFCVAYLSQTFYSLFGSKVIPLELMTSKDSILDRTLAFCLGALVKPGIDALLGKNNPQS